MLLPSSNRNYVHPFLGALGLVLLAACSDPTGGNTSTHGEGGCCGSTTGSGGTGGTGGDGGTGGTGGGDTGGMHWSRAVGSAVQGVAVGKSNHIFVTGTFTGTLDLGNGPIQAAKPDAIFVAELDSEGFPLSSKAFGGDGQAYVSKLVTDGQGNLLLSGRFLHTIDLDGTVLTAPAEGNFVVKLDDAGHVLWAKQLPLPSSGESPQVAANEAGDVVIIGVGDVGFDFGGGTVALGGAPYVARYDASGKHVYSRRLTTAGSDASAAAMTRAVSIAGSGKVVVVGAYTGHPDFGGGALPDTPNLGGFVVEVDATGKHVFSTGRVDAYTQNVVFDAAGDILVGSSLFPSWVLPTVIEVAKLDGTTGNQTWAKTFAVQDDNGQAYVYGLAVDAAGTVGLTGIFNGKLDIGSAHLQAPLDSAEVDIYVAKLDAQGNPLYGAALSGPGDEAPYDVVVDQDGNLLVVGEYGASIDFDGKSTLPGNDAAESGFLAKMVP